MTFLPIPPHKRRPRYAGKNPRRFEEKYKELDPARYAADVATVLASGITPATPPFYLEIATGTYALTVRDAATGTTLATVDSYDAAAGSVFTLFVAGTPTQTTASLVQDR